MEVAAEHPIPVAHRGAAVPGRLHLFSSSGKVNA